MAINNHSESGFLEDLIRSIVQLTCSEGHLKTLIEKTEAELENGIINVDDMEEVSNALEKIEEMQEELTEVADIRRRSMIILYDYASGDKTYWCQVKHLANAMYTMHEAYIGSDNDIRLYELALETNKQFIRALTHFMGFEISMCASCFSDYLKGENNNAEEENKL